MNKNIIETFTGLVVVVVAVYFSFFAYKSANSSVPEDSYRININFDRVDGLSDGSLVMISGLAVGTVSDLSLNEDTYLANVEASIKDMYKLPKDSSAEIISAGLLGSKYIAIVPGGSDEYLKDGDLIKYSQGSISLEGLIGKFMFGNSDDEEEETSSKSNDDTKVSPENDFF